MECRPVGRICAAGLIGAATILGGASALGAPAAGSVQTLRFVEHADPNGGGYLDAPPAATREGDVSVGDTFFFAGRLLVFVAG